MEAAKDDAGGAGRSSPATASDGAKKAQRERQSLLLSRAYVLRQIESSTNERYTQSLQHALHDIDQKIARLAE